jgi:hypothetical protein
MSEVLNELVSIRRKLESIEKSNNEQLMQQLTRLGQVIITKEDIRSSKINEILRAMSKNPKDAYSGIIVSQAKRIRENWKKQLNRNKELKMIKKKAEIMEISKKVKKDHVRKDNSSSKMQGSGSLSNQKHSFVMKNGKNTMEDDESVYNNEYMQYYDELEDKKRKTCFTMLNKIFEALRDIVARVFRDRLQLKQHAFNDQMKFSFSDFFYKFHKDSFLLKSKR